LYQRGMKLSAACDTTLKNAEKKVNDLIKEEAEDVKNDESTDE
ncbi:exodeoxyribonuclease VII small subunit, partial [Staphylococcus aureus]